MNLGQYFATLRLILMATTFVTLILIFLYMLYGKEEKTS